MERNININSQQAENTATTTIIIIMTTSITTKEMAVDRSETIQSGKLTAKEMRTKWTPDYGKEENQPCLYALCAIMSTNRANWMKWNTYIPFDYLLIVHSWNMVNERWKIIHANQLPFEILKCWVCVCVLMCQRLSFTAGTSRLDGIFPTSFSRCSTFTAAAAQCCCCYYRHHHHHPPLWLLLLQLLLYSTVFTGFFPFVSPHHPLWLIGLYAAAHQTEEWGKTTL